MILRITCSQIGKQVIVSARNDVRRRIIDDITSLAHRDAPARTPRAATRVSYCKFVGCRRAGKGQVGPRRASQPENHGGTEKRCRQRIALYSHNVLPTNI